MVDPVTVAVPAEAKTPSSVFWMVVLPRFRVGLPFPLGLASSLKAVPCAAWDPTRSFFLGDPNYLFDYGTFRILRVSCP